MSVAAHPAGPRAIHPMEHTNLFEYQTAREARMGDCLFVSLTMNHRNSQQNVQKIIRADRQGISW